MVLRLWRVRRVRGLRSVWGSVLGLVDAADVRRELLVWRVRRVWRVWRVRRVWRVW